MDKKEMQEDYRLLLGQYRYYIRVATYQARVLDEMSKDLDLDVQDWQDTVQKLEILGGAPRYS